MEVFLKEIYWLPSRVFDTFSETWSPDEALSVVKTKCGFLDMCQMSAIKAISPGKWDTFCKVGLSFYGNLADGKAKKHGMVSMHNTALYHQCEPGST